MLAASTQVNLPVFTGKLHVTQVNCVWGLFTCELQVKLPAFAGNFARASFTVYVVETPSDVRLTSFVKMTMGLAELRTCGSHRIRKIHPDM